MTTTTGAAPRNTFWNRESVNNRFTYCVNERARGQVEVYRQLSRNACNYGQSWGNDNGRVWVDKAVVRNLRCTESLLPQSIQLAN